MASDVDDDLAVRYVKPHYMSPDTQAETWPLDGAVPVAVKDIMRVSYSNMSVPLKRGAACLPCRRRKIRCNGARPVCDQCRRIDRQASCQYGGTGQLSHTELLQREIVRLKSRIQDLEPPQPISLSDPYVSQDTSTHMASSVMTTETEESMPYVAGPATAYPDYSDYNFGTTHLIDAIDIETPLSFDLESTSTSSPGLSHPESTPPQSWWEPEKPLEERVHQAINDLAPNARQFGFFLDLASELRTSPNARQHGLGQEHEQSHSRDEEQGAGGLHKTVLRNVVVLWAVHFSRDTALKVQEPAVLGRTLALLRDAITDISAPSAALYVLQVELALAYYFVRDARWYEARHHANAAARFVLDFGIPDVALRQANAEDGAEKSFSAFRNYPGCGWYSGGVARLDRTVCADAVHSVCILDQALACFLSIEPVLSAKVTERIFPTMNHDTLDESTAFAREACASVLLYRATAVCNTKKGSTASASELEATISSLIDHVDTCRTLAGSSRNLDDRTFLTLKSLLYLARIQIKLPLVDKDTAALDGIIETLVGFADTMANIDVLAIRPFNPIMASVWIAIAHLLNVELQRAHSSDHPRPSETAAAGRLSAAGSQLIQQLLMLGETIPLKSFTAKVESMMPLMMALQGCA
ncbi:hypothetical protein CONPUDRAFT_169994 [Coniophora puteana RWD-64-598 SS2]|uniref:Zn(2)-C6 fungal-type domain-containing protein n=1 Tax=Coniophora puteana (strain RWD-64-598) TaxID=741705 RepID=R7SEN4_CONPW|nr:uncharacterized protein CONPUDRAFT_169994 [Coniophora puteana RWD-64-598 SS2]EIW74641.1 hypothetical protein CONPUDRAFT_169994 [Coniophora puteana RWD-64-598 SS2]